MTSLPSIEDLRLVDAVARHGSVGSAARELLVSQPSASQRLAALERRIGIGLFNRDTTGARPTAAGAALAAEAAHVLRHLSSMFETARSAGDSRWISVGTLPSLAGMIFPLLDELVVGAAVHQSADHGPVIVADIGDGQLDAGIVGVASQLTLPRGVVAQTIGHDRLVTLRPEAAPSAASARSPFRGQTVITCAIDLSGEALHRRLAELGASPIPAATGEAAVLLAHRRACPVVLPGMLARWHASPGDRLEPAPHTSVTTLSLVSRQPMAPELAAVLPELRQRLGLPSQARSRARRSPTQEQ